MTSSHPTWPLCPGQQACYNGLHKGFANSREPANPQKVILSSDRSLQLDSVKLESLVIADQNAAVNTFSGPCTHRPSRHGSLLYRKSGAINPQGR